MPRPRLALNLIARRLRGDREAGYRLANWCGRRLAPGHVFAEYGRSWMNDGAFMSHYKALTGGGLLEQADKKFTLRSLARWANQVEGEIAECGAFRGVSARFMADVTEPKGLHIFDSFEGLSAPGQADGSHWTSGDLAAPEAVCRATLGGHAARATFHKGWIPDRFEDVADLRFALVHIDVDLFEPHADAIAFFWPRISDGGMIVFDDYGSEFCPGARRAVDDAFPAGEIVELPTGQAFVVKR